MVVRAIKKEVNQCRGSQECHRGWQKQASADELGPWACGEKIQDD